MEHIAEVDAVDRAILAVIRDFARIPNVEIARRLALRTPPVHLSPSAVGRRLASLEQSGAIIKYVTVIDHQRAERATEGYIELTFHSGVALEAAIEAFLEIAEIREASLVTGDADAILRFRVAGTADLAALIERIRSSGNVQRSKTLLAIDRVRRSPAGFATTTTKIRSTNGR